MSKQKNKKEATHKPPLPKKAAAPPPSPYLALAGILVVSFLTYIPLFNNGLLAWDDHNYISENPLVTSFQLEKIFTTDVMGNYHPLTILVLAIGYKIFGLQAGGYHGLSLVLHLLNTIMVFFVIRRISGRDNVALVATLLFGIHPIHVESVAWAAELKDLLYTFFFLLSWRIYLSYMKSMRWTTLLLCLLAFGLAMLSKAMAASLPVVLLLTDYYMQRKADARMFLEKLPFFLLAAILGVVAVIAQKTQSNPAQYVFPVGDRLLFACSSFMDYLFKLLLPIHLYAYYPYPVLSGQPLPSSVWLGVAGVVALAAVTIYSLKYSRTVFFSMAFFAVTIFLVLQLLPVGGARMADRYCYVPSIGIFFLAGMGAEWLRARKKQVVVTALLVLCTVFFGYKTFAQSKAWKNDLSLWNDVIRQDQGSAVAYNNRAMVYMKDNDSRAIDDFTHAVTIDPKYFLSFFNRGVLQANAKNLQPAIADYTAAIALKPKYTEAFVNRGNARMDLGILKEARDDYDSAIAANPDFARAWFNRGLLSMKEQRDSDAVADFDHAINLNPGYEKAWLNRGNVQMNTKKYEEARKSYTQLIAINGSHAEGFYNRAWAGLFLKDTAAACQDLQHARTLGFQVPDNALSRVCVGRQ